MRLTRLFATSLSVDMTLKPTLSNAGGVGFFVKEGIPFHVRAGHVLGLVFFLSGFYDTRPRLLLYLSGFYDTRPRLLHYLSGFYIIRTRLLLHLTP